MAKLEGPLDFTGRIGKLVCYRLPNTDKLVIRMPGGITAEQVRTLDSMEITRLRNSEFSGRSKAAGRMAAALQPLKPVVDYSITGAFNKILFKTQEADTVRPLGSRNISIALAADMLKGLNLNRKTGWEQVIVSPMEYSIDRSNGIVMVSVPALVPGYNFHPLPSYPVFSLIAAFGFAPDYHFVNDEYRPAYGRYDPSCTYKQSAWYPVQAGCGALQLEWPASEKYLEDNMPGAWLLSVALLYGQHGPGGNITPVKYKGAGKIVGVI